MTKSGKETKIKETIIHDTKFIELELPRVYWEEHDIRDFSNNRKTIVSVSDKSSAKALITLKNLLKIIEVK